MSSYSSVNEESEVPFSDEHGWRSTANYGIRRADVISFRDGRSLCCQDEEGRLKRIVGIGGVPQLPTARRQHH